MKRFFKYLFRILLAIIGLVVLVMLLLYLPPVQKFAKKQIVSYVTKNYGLDVRIGKLSIGFPLDLKLEDVYAGKSATDTLVALETLHLDVGLRHILQKRLGVNELLVENVKFVMPGDSLKTGMDVKAGKLRLIEGDIHLKKKWIEAKNIELKEAAILMEAVENSQPDTVVAEPVDWIFSVGEIDLGQIRFNMKSAAMPHLGAGIGEGQLTRGMVSLGGQTVDVGGITIDGAWCDLTTANRSKDSLPDSSGEVAEADTAKSLWTVKAGTLWMKNSAFSLASGTTEQTSVVLSGIAVRIDSIYNRGTVVRADLRDLQAVQKNGIEVRQMQADVDLDTTKTSLGKVYIHTRNSSLNLDIRSNTDLSGLLDKAPVNVTLDAQVGLADIEPFYGGLPRQIKNKTVGIKAACAVGSDRVDVSRLAVSMPGNLDVTANGKLSSFRDLKKLSGDFKIQGTFPDITFLNDFLQAGGLNVPRNLSFTADLKALQGVMDFSGRLCQRNGCLLIEANYNMPAEIYNATLTLNDFPLNRFLPADSLGEVSADLRLAGRGLDWRKAEAEVTAGIRAFEYKRHSYENIRMEAAIRQTRLKGKLVSADSAAKFDLTFGADSVENRYEAELKGKIGNVDLKELNLMPNRLAVGLGIDLRASQGENDTYGLKIRLDSIQMTDANRRYGLGDIELDLESNRAKTGVTVNSGDFALSAQVDTGLTQTIALLGEAATEITRQIGEKNIDMELVEAHLPDFSFDMNSGQQNTVARFLKARNIGFRKLTVAASSGREDGFRFSTRIDAPFYAEVKLDSVELAAWQSDRKLEYSFTVDGSANQEKGPFHVNFTGNMLGNHFRSELEQKDGKGDIGFDLGMGVTLEDSAVSVNFFPMTPILGYRRWIVNSDNKIVIGEKGKIDANLRFAYADKLISVQSLGNEGEQKERLKIEIKGVDLDAMSRLLPFSPDLSGQLNTDLLIYSFDDGLGVNGEIEVNEFYYQKQRVGTIELDMDYSAGQHFSAHAVDFKLKLDSLRRVVAKGEFSTGQNDKSVSVDVDITDFPLQAVDAFIPNNLLNLQGLLVGGIRFRGTFDNPELEGALAFENGAAELLMIGTTFGLDTGQIVIKDNKLTFDRFRIFAPNQSTLTMNGDIRLLPFDQLGANLTVSGRNFQVVNVKQNPSSLIFGKAYVDLNTQIAGAFSALNVTGNVNLLNNTAITYTLRSNDPELQDRSADLVRFVSFRDSSLTEKDDLTNRVSVNNFMLKMLVEIGDNVKMSVYLSEDGQNNVLIQGGGNLILSMDPESGLTLSGKYTLTSGTVAYNVPVAGKKVFNIQTGSFVEWTGDLVNPRLSISASEQVKATVEDGDRNRQVTFESIIRIQNTLSKPEITFDLSAPNDMVIQNQLATFSPEERTKQAMNLLIYGTYTGPGAVSSNTGNMANNALYGFVENELNKYTRNTGLTFGFDSYNTDSETTRTDFTYQFSKQLFNDKVSVKIGGRVSSDNSEGNADNNLQDNLVDDISIEYRFTKKRNLFLKVFRHSNYESVLEGEVVQTGIGIVWRKSFRKLKDLFIRKSKRETVQNTETVKGN